MPRSGERCVHIAAEFLVELRLARRDDHAVRDDLRAQPKALVERLPHRDERGRTEDERRPIVRVAEAQLAEQFGSDERLAEPHDVADVAAAVHVDHPEAASHRVQLEVGQLVVPRRQRQIFGAGAAVVELVECLQVDVIREASRPAPTRSPA